MVPCRLKHGNPNIRSPKVFGTADVRVLAQSGGKGTNLVRGKQEFPPKSLILLNITDVLMVFGKKTVNLLSIT